MKRFVLFSTLVLAFSFACKKDEKKDAKTEPPASKEVPAPADIVKANAPTDGARAVAINVSAKGYSPSLIEAKAQEKLRLDFTRTEDTECGAYIQVEGVEVKTELPLNQLVSIPVTMPEDGELTFACGMDMMTGKVVIAAAD